MEPSLKTSGPLVKVGTGVIADGEFIEFQKRRVPGGSVTS